MKAEEVYAEFRNRKVLEECILVDNEDLVRKDELLDMQNVTNLDLAAATNPAENGENLEKSNSQIEHPEFDILAEKFENKYKDTKLGFPVAYFDLSKNFDNQSEFLDGNEIYSSEISGKYSNRLGNESVTGSNSAKNTDSNSAAVSNENNLWNLAYRDIFYVNENAGFVGGEPGTQNPEDQTVTVAFQVILSNYVYENILNYNVNFVLYNNDDSKNCENLIDIKSNFKQNCGTSILTDKPIDAGNSYTLIKTQHIQLRKNKLGYMMMLFVEDNSTASGVELIKTLNENNKNLESGMSSGNISFNFNIEILSRENKVLINSREMLLDNKRKIESIGKDLYWGWGFKKVVSFFTGMGFYRELEISLIEILRKIT